MKVLSAIFIHFSQLSISKYLQPYSIILAFFPSNPLLLVSFLTASFIHIKRYFFLTLNLSFTFYKDLSNFHTFFLLVNAFLFSYLSIFTAELVSFFFFSPTNEVLFGIFILPVCCSYFFSYYNSLLHFFFCHVLCCQLPFIVSSLSRNLFIVTANISSILSFHLLLLINRTLHQSAIVNSIRWFIRPCFLFLFLSILP